MLASNPGLPHTDFSPCCEIKLGQGSPGFEASIVWLIPADFLCLLNFFEVEFLKFYLIIFEF